MVGKIKKYSLILLVVAVAAFLVILNLKPENELAKASSIIAERCKNETSSEQCYAKAFETLTNERDMDFSFAALLEVQKMDPRANGCHFIAHSITIAETEKDPSRWKEIMKRAPQNCSYGGAHGALEVHAASFPDGKLPESEVLSACDVPDTNNCTHILGHLILVMQNNDIKPSTALCKELPHGSRGVFECITGVFMERITGINLVEHGLADKRALNWPERLPEMRVLCQSQNGADAVGCWKEITHVALTAFNYEPQKIIDFCETASPAEAVQECQDHAVGIIAGHKIFNLSELGDTCSVQTSDSLFRDRCYTQLVSATLSTLPHASEQAVEFCNNLSVDYQKECFTMIGNSLFRSTGSIKKTQHNACATAPREYQIYCTNGGKSAYTPTTLD